MPILSGPLQNGEAIVDAEIGWSAARAGQLRAALQPVPVPVQGRALIDTGAEMTCVDADLVRPLNLPFHSATLANLPAHGGLTVSPMSYAGLIVLHPSGNVRDHLHVRNLIVLELSLAGLGYGVLIGCDVLAGCRFLYDGPGDRFELEY
jgi:hypothetical protein